MDVVLCKFSGAEDRILREMLKHDCTKSGMSENQQKEQGFTYSYQIYQKTERILKGFNMNRIKC